MANALGDLGVPEALPILIQLENDPASGVRTEARVARQRIEKMLTSSGGELASSPSEE